MGMGAKTTRSRPAEAAVVSKLPKKKCCVATVRCNRCPIQMLKEGTLPAGYTVKQRRLVRVDTIDEANPCGVPDAGAKARDAQGAAEVIEVAPTPESLLAERAARIEAKVAARRKAAAKAERRAVEAKRSAKKAKTKAASKAKSARKALKKADEQRAKAKKAAKAAKRDLSRIRAEASGLRVSGGRGSSGKRSKKAA